MPGGLHVLWAIRVRNYELSGHSFLGQSETLILSTARVSKGRRPDREREREREGERDSGAVSCGLFDVRGLHGAVLQCRVLGPMYQNVSKLLCRFHAF